MRHVKRPGMSSLGSTGCILMQSVKRSLEYIAGGMHEWGHLYQGCVEENRASVQLPVRFTHNPGGCSEKS